MVISSAIGAAKWVLDGESTQADCFTMAGLSVHLNVQCNLKYFPMFFLRGREGWESWLRILSNILLLKFR